jgi:hypothetical protein
MPIVWIVLLAGLVVESAHALLHLGGTGQNLLFDDWLHDSLMVAAALLCLWRAIHYPERDCRAGWTFIGVAYLVFAVGDVMWSLLYSRTGLEPNPAYPIPPDFLYLAWYPLMFVGLGLLVHDRVPRFELHRWIDGIVVMIIVATPGITVVLQPLLERPSPAGPLEKAVDIAPAFGDVLLLGGILGVYGLMAWRPARAWLLIGLSLMLTTLGDDAFAVQGVGAAYQEGHYDFLWTAGALIIAWAAWHPAPARLEPKDIFGWRAIALPVAAQGLGAAVQIYGLFQEIPTSERLITFAVLVIGTMQIIASRPQKNRQHRARAAPATPSSTPRELPEATAGESGREVGLSRTDKTET